VPGTSDQPDVHSGQQLNNILCGRELNREGHPTKNLPFSEQGGRP